MGINLNAYIYLQLKYRFYKILQGGMEPESSKQYTIILYFNDGPVTQQSKAYVCA